MNWDKNLSTNGYLAVFDDDPGWMDYWCIEHNDSYMHLKIAVEGQHLHIIEIRIPCMRYAL